jgi:hypothetical protein
MGLRINRGWIVGVCAVLSAGGCQSSTEEAVEEPAAVAAADAPADPPSEATAPASTEPTPPAAGEAPAAAPKTLAADTFTPPFPERLELFEPPKRAQGSVRQDDEKGTSVELKGFVNVNGPHVVLSIDGVIALLPEGGEKYGVQVKSIDPPTAVLQRGRLRWPAKLE